MSLAPTERAVAISESERSTAVVVVILGAMVSPTTSALFVMLMAPEVATSQRVESMATVPAPAPILVANESRFKAVERAFPNVIVRAAAPVPMLIA